MVDLTGQYQGIREEVNSSISQILETAAFINGPQVHTFQAALEKYLGIRHVIPCANGTDALQIAMMGLGLKPGDEVITADFTFAATVEVIALLQLVFVAFPDRDDVYQPMFWALAIMAYKARTIMKERRLLEMELVPIAELFAVTYVAQQLQIALGKYRTIEAMTELTMTTSTEINSALQTIIGHCNLIDRTHDDPGLHRDIGTIVRQAQRIAGHLEKMRNASQRKG